MENEADRIARYLRNVESETQVFYDRLLVYKIQAFTLVTGETPACIGCGTDEVSMLRDIRNDAGALSGTVWSCSDDFCSKTPLSQLELRENDDQETPQNGRTPG